jgi:Zinc knuckle
MSNSLSTKGVTLTVLDPDDKSKFMAWDSMFHTFFMIGDLDQFLSKTKHPGLPATADKSVLDETKDADKIKALNLHSKAVGFMTYAFSHVDVCGLVNKSKSSEWPRGQAHLIYRAYQAKFFPDDYYVAGAALQQKLADIPKMAEFGDPNKIFAKIAQCVAEAPTVVISEERLTEIIISKMPMNYMSTVQAITDAKGAGLTREELEIALEKRYRLIQLSRSIGSKSGKKKSSKDDSDDEDTEVALNAIAGKCFKCGVKGHRAAECPKKKDSGGNKSSGKSGTSGQRKFQGNCNNCGKKGHKADDCWDLEKNRSKRPSNYRSGGGNQSGNGNSTAAATLEVIMYASTRVPSELNGSSDLIMCDTAASAHVMNSTRGARNLIKKEKNSLLANKTVMKTSQVGDYALNFYDQKGNQTVCGLLKEATVSPGGINLFAAGTTSATELRQIVRVRPPWRSHCCFFIGSFWFVFSFSCKVYVCKIPDHLSNGRFQLDAHGFGYNIGQAIPRYCKVQLNS